MSKGFIGASGYNAYLGNIKMRAGYIGAIRVYSTGGNTVTYHVDTGITYQEDVDSGASCLSPKSFTPSKTGWTFVGWRQNKTVSGNVLSDLTMGDSPITLYAVFRQAVTVTYYNNSTTASNTSGYRYYNNGNMVNPSFTLSQASRSGWTARGWSTSSAGNGSVAYANGASFTRDSNVTLYGMYQQTITVTYYNGSSTAATTSGTRYYNSNGNIANPTFTLTPASLSGWTFRGWVTSSAAAASIAYSSISGTAFAANTTVYAAYSQTITLSYSGNGATSGSTAAQTGTRYYNSGSGDYSNPAFTLRTNGFARTNYTFSKWAVGSTSGTQYAAGASVILSANTTMYALWTAIPATPFYISSKNLTYTTYWKGYWQISGIGTTSVSSSFSRQNCTKVKFVCFLDAGYFTVGSKRVDLRGKGNGSYEETIIDISDQPETISCSLEVTGGGKTSNDIVQISDPYFY